MTGTSNDQIYQIFPPTYLYYFVKQKYFVIKYSNGQNESVRTKKTSGSLIIA